jgi:2-hydroxychromene-2-carboxylate isomerase
MSTSFEFFYDFISPYSYLAATQVEDLARRTNARLIYRPVFLGGLFKEAGNHPPLEIIGKARYLPKDVADWAKHYGVPVTYPPTFPFNSVKAMRGALMAEKEGKVAEYTQLGFTACWGEGKDLGDPQIVGQVAEAAGLDREKLLVGIEDPAVKEELKKRTSDSVERGAFGLPTFFVEGEMFWGNDRIVLLEERLKRAG